MSGLTRTPSPSSLSIGHGHGPCSSSASASASASATGAASATVPQQHPGSPSPNRSAKTSLASSTKSDNNPGEHQLHQNEKASTSTSTFSMGLGRLLFRASSSGSKRDSIDSSRSDEAGRSPNGSRPTSPSSQPKSPQRSRSKRLANFASRSIRKHQWRLFKHRTFFGSMQRNSIKTKNQLQLPRLTLRHPSVDSAAMPFPIDVEETQTTRSEDPETEFLQIRRKNQRRWTDSDAPTRLRDSRDSSDFHDSHDTLDVVVGTSGSTIAGAGSTGAAGGSGGGGGGGLSDHHHSMTAPVSPNVPLSASSSHSDGWKYSSQKLLWKLKPRYINFSHASSTSSSTDSAWKSLDSMTWRSVDGAEVILRGARLENLSEIEKTALQVFAGQRLSKMLPGVNLGKQKDPLLFSTLRQKRQKLVKSNRAPTVADVQRRASGTPCPEGKRVFGVSLATCMLNEKRLDQESRCKSLDDSAVCLMNNSRTGKQVAKPVKSEPEIVSQPTSDDRKWLYPSTQNLYPSSSSNPSSPSPVMGSMQPPCSIMPQSNHLLTAEPEVQQITGRFAKKTRPSSASFSCSLDATTDDVDPHALQVPRIVENCTQYLMTYGLNQVGLFRVAGNTKRCRQLRNALEKVGSGTAINDNMVENTTAHDVATLLKEYFRDLPQSLLPKENYQAYIAAAKLNIEDRIEAVRLLFALLESPNLDTIFVLMKFLHEVSTHWHDKYTPTGEVLQGNKMDARNLATIFAPSILRADHDKLHESLAENEQQITIVETMITNVEEIFRIPKELQCKIYTKLRETEPDRLDRILNYLSKMDSHDHSCGGMLSPFPATVEEDPTSPRVHHRYSHQDHSHIGRQSPLARELTTNGKVKVQSQRSGSWPFSLTRTQTSPNRQEHSQRFFPSDEESVNSANPKDDSHHSDDRRSKHLVKQYSKSASNTPCTSRRPTECQLKVSTDDSGRESEYWPDELTVIEQQQQTSSQSQSQQNEIEGRARAETVDGTTSKSSKKTPNMATLAGTQTSKSVDARSPSRERVDTFRTAARSSAAAARRRLRNVVRAFRWSSVARSTPDIVAQTSN